MTPCRHPVVTLSTPSEGVLSHPVDTLCTHQDQDQDLYPDLRPARISEAETLTSGVGLGKEEEPRADVGALPSRRLARGNDLHQSFSRLAELLFLRPHAAAQGDVDHRAEIFIEQFPCPLEGEFRPLNTLPGHGDFQVQKVHRHESIFAVPSIDQQARGGIVPVKSDAGSFAGFLPASKPAGSTENSGVTAGERA